MADQFDPTKHTVKDVRAYLDGVREAGNEEEYVRVIEAERNRTDGDEARVSIVGLYEAEKEQDDFAAGSETQDAEQDDQDAVRTEPTESTESTDASDDEETSQTQDGPTTDPVVPMQSQAAPSGKPKWDVRTHGKPPFGREDEYEVVGR